MSYATLGSSGRFSNQGSGTVDANGNCSINLGTGTLGVTLAGSVTVYGSPPGVIWLLQINQQTWDAGVGVATVSGVTLDGNETLTVVTGPAYGLAAVLDPGLTIPAVFSGRYADSDTLPFILPGADSVGGTTATYGSMTKANHTFVLGAGSAPFVVPTSNYVLLAAWLAVGSGPALGALFIQEDGAGSYVLMVGSTPSGTAGAPGIPTNGALSYPGGIFLTGSTSLTLVSNGPAGYGGVIYAPANIV